MFVSSFTNSKCKNIIKNNISGIDGNKFMILGICILHLFVAQIYFNKSVFAVFELLANKKGN